MEKEIINKANSNSLESKKNDADVADVADVADDRLKGGYKLFDFGGDTFTKAIKRTKTSEGNLIKNYQEMDSVTKKYNKAYDAHIQNLEKLDDYANFTGMENLFKKVIMKENFRNGKVDKSLPILFKNYLIETETTPSAFRKEHIMRQVTYVLDKYFAGREHMFIKNMHVEVGKHEFVLYVQTIENIKKSRKIEHNGYVISISETKSALKEILATTKKNLKRKSKLIVFDNNESSSSSVPTKKKKKSFNSSEYDSKNKTKTKTKTKTTSGTGTGKGTTKKKRTRSSGNLSIFGKSNNTEKDSKSNRESSEGEDKLPSGIAIGTEKAKDSTKKSVLDIYLTPSQKKAKTAIQGIPAATTFAAPLPPPPTFAPAFAPAFGQPAGLEQAKANILQAPGLGFQQPAPIAPQPGVAPGAAAPGDPEDARCAAIPTPATRDQCNYQGCWESGGRCIKKGAPRPKPAFGGPPPFGAPPPFGGPPPAPFGGPPPPPVAAAPAFAPGAFAPAPAIAL